MIITINFGEISEYLSDCLLQCIAMNKDISLDEEKGTNTLRLHAAF